jgi:hypothetical protein
VLDDDREVIRIQCYIRLDIKSCIRLCSPADCNTQRGGHSFLSLYDRLHHFECYVCYTADRMEVRDRRIPSH